MNFINVRQGIGTHDAARVCEFFFATFGVDAKNKSGMLEVECILFTGVLLPLFVHYNMG
jgi:hypothetical protein